MFLDDVPRELNGKPVIHAEPHKNCATVLVENNGEFIVATYWPELKNSWSWGHYFCGADAFKEATADFDKTAKRNSTR